MSAAPTRGGSLRARLRAGPLVERAAIAAERVADFRATVPAEARLAPLLDDTALAGLVAAIADHSPFLWRLIVTDPQRMASLLDEPPERSLDRIIDQLAEALSTAGLSPTGAMPLLRRARQSAALLVALADLGGVWDLGEVTEALTRFADAAVAGALAVLVGEAVERGKLEAGTLASDCGLTVLALGKGGGRELNYSSDIDLVVLFDPTTAAVPAGDAAAPLFVRMTQSLARLLGEATGDGFVLRVDLRLRPDPASTPVAIALPSAFSYYETLGQNWERAAFIKARPIAGDLRLGHRFLVELAPFIWRKYFDYAAIADIHAMKRQIHAVRGQAAVAVEGHNVKLGRGGIREIEFFVQTQQLIFGGRRPALRGAGTVAMLAALASDGWIDAQARDELTEAYAFLRQVEHRLQMVDDRQTQRLPTVADELTRFARFLGFSDRDAFVAVLLGHLRRVQHHYARLFENAPALDGDEGDLVFTGVEPDPGTLATLQRLGFARPADAAELVRGWHFGRRPAVRSPRAREVLTELVPALLQSLGRTSDPDGALATFDTMLGRIKAGVELLSLLRAHAGLRDVFADVLGSSPRLAATVAARPHVLDAAIDPAFLHPGSYEARDRIGESLKSAGRTEDLLDRMRDLAQEEVFRLGIRALTGIDDVTSSQGALTTFADTLIGAALARSLADIEAVHGRVPGGSCVVLGMGRLGSGEMTASSDLDLILIYRAEGEDSDGARPLDPARYYARLTQRLIAALTSKTRRGGLYDVDLRLRPSGRQGPLAVRFKAFSDYQSNEAQTWEHMALTRARVVAGEAGLADDVAAVIEAVLRRPRSWPQTIADIEAMRSLVAAEKGPGSLWDMKLAPGGLLDVEFLSQALVLCHADKHPELCIRHPERILDQASRSGLISAEDGNLLCRAHRLQSCILHMLRFMTDGSTDPVVLGAGAVQRLCQSLDQPDFEHVTADLIAYRDDAKRVCRRLLIHFGRFEG